MEVFVAELRLRALLGKDLGGRQPSFLEVEPFPSAVLMHRFGATKPLRPLDPEQADNEKDRKQRISWQKQIAELPAGGAIPNLGDFTLIKKGDCNGAIDLIVGGTPCQDLSIAGSDWDSRAVEASSLWTLYEFAVKLEQDGAFGKTSPQLYPAITVKTLPDSSLFSADGKSPSQAKDGENRELSPMPPDTLVWHGEFLTLHDVAGRTD